MLADVQRTTIGALAERFEVSKRTIAQGDLEARNSQACRWSQFPRGRR